MTRAWFDGQMARLLGLRFPPADLDTHWEALRDMPAAVLEAAITRAGRTRSDYPTPNEIRQDADIVATVVAVLEPAEDRAVALDNPFSITVPGAGTVVSIAREWRYYCDTCSDTGWDSVWCGDRFLGKVEVAKPWQPSMQCDRRGEHGVHEWVRRCVCYDTNPALVRKRAAVQKFAEEPAKVKR